MIEVKHIFKTFDGKTILNDISAQFFAGKTNLIIGKSGSGILTVLLRAENKTIYAVITITLCAALGVARVSASPREVKEKRVYSLFSSLFSLNERTKPIKIDDKAFDKKSITPSFVLLKVTVPTAVIIKPQPPQKLKHIKRFA